MYDLLNHGIEFFEWEGKDGTKYWGCIMTDDEVDILEKYANEYFEPSIDVTQPEASTGMILENYLNQIYNLKECLKLK